MSRNNIKYGDEEFLTHFMEHVYEVDTSFSDSDFKKAIDLLFGSDAGRQEPSILKRVPTLSVHNSVDGVDSAL